MNGVKICFYYLEVVITVRISKLFSDMSIVATIYSFNCLFTLVGDVDKYDPQLHYKFDKEVDCQR